MKEPKQILLPKPWGHECGAPSQALSFEETDGRNSNTDLKVVSIAPASMPTSTNPPLIIRWSIRLDFNWTKPLLF